MLASRPAAESAIDSTAEAQRRAASLRLEGLFWRRLAWLGSNHFPEWWRHYSPPFFAAAIFALVRRNREGLASNLGTVLATTDRARVLAVAYRTFVEFSHCLAETMAVYGPRELPVQVDLVGGDRFTAALEAGRGAIVVTGHFGNWDVAAKKLRDFGRPIHLVMARESNAETNEFVSAARNRADVRVLYSDTSVFSSINVIQVLRRNEIVALQLDRTLTPGGARMVPFFGRPAPFPVGPFALARLSGAPIVPIFFPRRGRDHYEIRVGAPVHVAREHRDGELLQQAMRRVVAEFESAVREFPTQWFQFQPFWLEDAPASSLTPAAVRVADSPPWIAERTRSARASRSS